MQSTSSTYQLHHKRTNMQPTIPFFRKFLLYFIAGLVCSMTTLRIVTRLALETGGNPSHTPAPLIAVAPALLIFLAGLVYPFVWQLSRQRKETDRERQAAGQFLICYGIALNLAMIGLQKWFGLQAHTHLALLDNPLSSFSGEDLSWAYFGRSPAFFNVIGGFQIIGSVLLVFRRTRLAGVLVLLPVMVNIFLMDYFYHFYPGELGQALGLLLGLLYLLFTEYDRLRAFFFQSTSRSGIGQTLARLSVLYIPLLLITCFFHLPEKDPAHGKYTVTNLWIDNKPVNLDNCGDSVLTRVYLDEGHDCLFEYNSRKRWLIGNYTIDRPAHRMLVLWHYPAHVHDTLVVQMADIPGGLSLDGRMGSAHIRMDWHKE